MKAIAGCQAVVLAGLILQSLSIKSITAVSPVSINKEMRRMVRRDFCLLATDKSRRTSEGMVTPEVSLVLTNSVFIRMVLS